MNVFVAPEVYIIYSCGFLFHKHLRYFRNMHSAVAPGVICITEEKQSRVNPTRGVLDEHAPLLPRIRTSYKAPAKCIFAETTRRCTRSEFSLIYERFSRMLNTWSMTHETPAIHTHTSHVLNLQRCVTYSLI